MTTVTQALDVFRAELGVRESPAGSNRTPYGARYGFNGVPWCAIFVSDCLTRAGLGDQYHFAAVASAVASAKRQGRHLGGPQVGSIACKLYTATQGHTGVVEAVDPDGTVVTIEGNTADGNDANGGMVMRRRRSPGFWNAGYYRIDYSGEPAVAAGPVYGADVSHHQGSGLDFAAMKRSGIAYCWIKATEGGSFVDPMYLRNRVKAGLAGVHSGAYDFIRPNVDPIRHAEHFFAVAGPHIAGDLRPALDAEVPGLTPAWLSAYRTRAESLFRETLTAYIATAIYQQPGIAEVLR